MSTSREAISRILVANQSLSYSGIDFFNKSNVYAGGTPDERARAFAKDRQLLLESAPAFEIAVAWLSGVEKTANVTTKYTSFAIKEMISRSTGVYIGNGVCICAGIHIGCEWRRRIHSHNAIFNLSARSMHDRQVQLKGNKEALLVAG